MKPKQPGVLRGGGPSDNVHIIALDSGTGVWAEPPNSALNLGHGGLGGLGLNAIKEQRTFTMRLMPIQSSCRFQIRNLRCRAAL